MDRYSVILLVLDVTVLCSAQFSFVSNHTTKVFSTETICRFPSFLKTALGISCASNKSAEDQLWFAPQALPVRLPIPKNGTCPPDRFAWPISGKPAACCLELACPAGQVLAKDERNTNVTECPKCRNVIFEYICDPDTDRCSQLSNGSTCRNFFNSTTLFICACDVHRGYTQNRLAFPAACTKTIGATCFLQEHCTMVDPNSYCDVHNGDKPPRGTCQCQNGTTTNRKGRCVNKNINATAIRTVRQVAVADWGDKSLWTEGAPQFPNFDLPKAPPAADPVMSQDFENEDIGRIPREDNTSATTEGPKANSTTPLPGQPKAAGASLDIVLGDKRGLAYMIAAQHMKQNASTESPVSVTVDSHEAIIQPVIHEEISIGHTPDHVAAKPEAGSVVLGTHFAPDNDDIQLDSALNILIKATKHKLQTERPTTSSTWDATVPSVSSAKTTQKSTAAPTTTPRLHVFTAMTKRKKFTSSTTKKATALTTTTTSSLSTPVSTASSTAKIGQFYPVTPEFTTKSTTSTAASSASSAAFEVLPVFEPIKPADKLLVDVKTTTEKSTVTSPVSTDSTRRSTTTAASTSTSEKPTTTSRSTATSTPLTTPSSTTSTSTIATTKSTSRTSTARSTKTTSEIPSTTLSSTASVAPSVSTTAVGVDQSMAHSVNAGSVKIKLGGDDGRFGGVARIPSHAVIGGVSRPDKNVWSSIDDSVLASWLLNAVTSTSKPRAKSSETVSAKPTSTPTSTSTTKPTTAISTTKATLVNPASPKLEMDLSFLQNPGLSHEQMRDQLVKVLLELSATTTSTTTTTTTTRPPMDLSFLNDPHLTSNEVQMRLIPLLMQLNSEINTQTVPSVMEVATTTPATNTTTKHIGVDDMENRIPVGRLRMSSTALPSTTTTTTTPTATTTSTSTTTTTTTTPTTTPTTTSTATTKRHVKPIYLHAADTTRPTAATTVMTTTQTTTEDPYEGLTPKYPHKKKKVSFWGALMNSLAAVTPHPKTNADIDGDGIPETTIGYIIPKKSTVAARFAATLAPKALRTTTTTSTTPARTTAAKSVNANAAAFDPSGMPVPTFNQVVSGLAGLVGGVLGKRPTRLGETTPSPANAPQADSMGISGNDIKIKDGKLDLTDPRTQLAVAKLMQEGQSSGPFNSGAAINSKASRPTSAADLQAAMKNSGWDFTNPNKQMEFVKFLDSMDRYPVNKGPANPGLFPQPPPSQNSAAQYVPPPATTTTTTTATQKPEPAPYRPVLGLQSGNGVPVMVDSLTPEAMELIQKMQRPGYYNVTKEQLSILQPILKELQSQQGQAAFEQAPYNPQPNQRPPYPPNAVPQQPETWFGGDPYATFGAIPPAPPVLPQQVYVPPTEPSPPTTTSTTTTTTTTTPVPPPPVPKVVVVSESKSLVPDNEINSVYQAPLVKNPSLPPFSAVVQDKGCEMDCAAADLNSVCDRTTGNCVCRPGFHSSLLEGDICTRTIFSLCSSDDDCRSGGDINAECAFNGVSRFCTCSNGYLEDDNGVCKPMFPERCFGSCSIPNAICDPVKFVCRCPTGYAWFRDPWTGQPVCRAALGGRVPCRSDQDLCPIYTPRGQCRNSAFCGCEEGYIPDSWFTNQSERTSCIDVLSAKCDDSSDCTTADLNTMCDRRLRMCVCKPGYKPDPLHNSACIIDS